MARSCSTLPKNVDKSITVVVSEARPWPPNLSKLSQTVINRQHSVNLTLITVLSRSWLIRRPCGSFPSSTLLTFTDFFRRSGGQEGDTFINI